MKREIFILGITFSYLGAKSEVEAFLGTSDFVVEVNEFAGTDEEHNSGIVNYPLVVNDNENTLCKLNELINEKNLKGEYFCLRTQSGIEILTEDQYNEITF